VRAFLDVAHFAVEYWLGEEKMEGEDKGRLVMACLARLKDNS
jgi:hypothetical protein